MSDMLTDAASQLTAVATELTNAAAALTATSTSVGSMNVSAASLQTIETAALQSVVAQYPSVSVLLAAGAAGAVPGVTGLGSLVTLASIPGLSPQVTAVVTALGAISPTGTSTGIIPGIFTKVKNILF